MTTVEPTTDSQLDREVCIADANRRLLTALHQLSEAPSLEQGLLVVAELLRSIAPFDNLGVLLLDDLGRELRFALALGYPEGVAEHWRFGLGQGLVGSVAESGKPLLCSDTSGEPRYLDAAPDTRAEVAVPLCFRDRVIGQPCPRYESAGRAGPNENWRRQPDSQPRVSSKPTT